jgi:hypothetical protein
MKAVVFGLILFLSAPFAANAALDSESPITPDLPTVTISNGTTTFSYTVPKFCAEGMMSSLLLHIDLAFVGAIPQMQYSEQFQAVLNEADGNVLDATVLCVLRFSSPSRQPETLPP